MKFREDVSFFLREEKPAAEEAEGLITDPMYLWGLSKRVESGVSSTENGIGVAEPETMDKEQHLAGLSFKSIDDVRLDSLWIRRWCVRLFVVIRLKSSA